MRVFLFIAAAVLTGCQGQINPSEADLRNPGIISGHLITKRSNAAEKSLVALEILNKKNAVVSRCSAALIGPRTILTAAHCFDPALAPGLTGFRVLFESQYANLKPPRSAAGIAFVTHPEYNSTKIEATVVARDERGDLKTTIEMVPAYDHDIAIAVFSGNIPAGFAPITIDTAPALDHSNHEAEIYGYGRLFDYGDFAGRSPRNRAMAEGYLRKGRVQINGTYDQYKDRFFADLISTAQSACQGDSGGPMVIWKDPTQPIIVGVIASSIGDFLPSGIQSCKGPTMATKVATFASWIREQESILLEMK